MVSGHTGFIVAAYAVATVVIVAIVTTILLDYRAQRRMLAKLEKRTGIDKDTP